MIVPQQSDFAQETGQWVALPVADLQRHGWAILHLSDTELLTAMGVWLLSSASYRARVAYRPDPDRWAWVGTVTPQKALDAGAVLSHALTAQPGDLNRLIGAKHFRDGAYPLLAAAWATGATSPNSGDVTPLAPKSVPESPTVEAAAWDWGRRSWWWAIPACVVAFETIKALMFLGGAR